MAERINKAIELLAQDQPVYYASVHEVDYESGRAMAGTWADYINVSMEHGAFDMPGLAAFMRGLVDGGPTASGHRTPAVIVDLPPEGTSAADIRANAWVFKQALARGVHGILLCHAEDPEAVRTLVQVCRYAFRGETGGAPEGRRGAGGQGMAAHAWGVGVDEYARRADLWPLNPEGELVIGLKIENRRALERVDETLTVPGVAFAEWGPGTCTCPSATCRRTAASRLRSWRRAGGSSRPAAGTGCSSSTAPAAWWSASTKACASSPAPARSRPGSDGPTPGGRWRSRSRLRSAARCAGPIAGSRGGSPGRRPCARRWLRLPA